MNPSPILLLDVGNSRLKAATIVHGLWVDVQAVRHHGSPAAAFERSAFDAAGAVWVADVTGGSTRRQLDDAIRRRLAVAAVHVASEASRAGLTNAYAEPTRLGVDRWLMLVAAWMEVRGPLCVVSVGTAVTFDSVDASGRHLGGVIAPGLHAAQAAVLATTRFTADGPRRDFSEALGTDTDSCVRQGAFHAVAGLIDRLAARRPSGAALFISGGDAERLTPHLAQSWTVRPNLVLEGLLRVATAPAKP